jgi:hypothetical protein
MPRVHFPRREEIATAGFDPFRQLAPDAFGSPASTGILLPPAPGFQYRVLLCSADLDVGDSLIGLRQYIDLVAYVGSGEGGGGAPIYPVRQPIDDGDPMFRLIDGGDTWTLTREPKVSPPRVQGPFDQDSFIFRDSEGSALVYEAAGFPALSPFPGYLGLNAYTPPPMRGTKVLSVRDRRWPWTKQSNRRIDYQCDSPARFRFYVDVLQSNPATRNIPSLTVGDGYSLPPPEGFLQQTFGGPDGPAGGLAVYGWVAGAMIIQRGDRRG